MRPQRLCRWPLWGALLLLSSVAATQIIIDDTSSSIIYTGSGWQDDTSSYNAGGSAHQTDIPGNQAALNFTGNSIVMYGKTMYGGAEFSFSVDGNVKECSCYQSDASTTTYQVTLCQTTGLQSGTHQLLVTHVGQANTWLNVDQFM
ncbi:hypothetical protein DL93DRAFT_1211594 [Clavulina sp. PMI_390]|nr:hypothetical protein DL93DRAFT_1211594 [Clavulina sp. PMI_390]